VEIFKDYVSAMYKTLRIYIQNILLMGNYKKTYFLLILMVSKLEHYFGLFVISLVIISIGLSATEFFIHSGSYRHFVELFDWFVLVIFLIDLGIEYKYAKNKKIFFKHYWIDMVAMIPFVTVLRILKFAKIFRILEVTRFFEIFRLRHLFHLRKIAALKMYEHDHLK